MKIQTYKWFRVIVSIFISITISLALIQNSYVLAAAGIFVGMVFLILVRSKARIRVDEREKIIREKAAQTTYAIFAPTIGIGAFLLLIPYRDVSPVFAKGEFVYLESLGMIFAYLTLFLIAIYAISYHFLNRKFGGGSNEE
ncbi:hypothetical protein COT62_03740 [Candidatus Roizmanbacteria bacterium CG09_land_8_20_14_0_10_41_9]|uniref:DUF2178 domain-containing protein n=1 Tax=Candidatus Roizmanbacteria bacterium CG09_land_8_20_14_0_10_41_9 TaxID=1974850 RepID=A0A2H0WS34_9BACT|nr:MAG: hypothetical protein COT62_03740 [Candidatus Roizmanbacteria bacterium CG09_land_8_20_14_0_10_41_9]